MAERPWFKFWPSHLQKSLEYPEITLHQALRRTAEKYPDKPAMIYLGAKMTFRELDELADRFATALQDLGVSKGDRVAIYLPNVPQFVIAYYGALRAGAIVVAVSPLYRERELEFILKDSGAKVLVAYDRLYPIVQNVMGRTKLEHVVTTSVRDYMPPLLRLLSPLVGVKSYACPGALDFKGLIRKYGPSPKPVEVDPKRDLAVLQYTGGTTGPPKGAMLTHYNLVVNCVQASSWLPMVPEDVSLTALPLFHIYGMTVAMNAPIYMGGTFILIPDPRDITRILKTIQKHRPTIFCGVPTMYVAILNHPKVKKFDLRSIRACISGAAALPLEVQRKFEEMTGGRLVEGYGLTEASPVTHANPLDDPKKNRPGSIGIPMADTDARIVDVDTGEKELPPGEVGELVVKGPQVMLGYWNRPEETKLALRDGWLYTGDIAKMDEDGYFYIVDRKKDMVNVSGFKVWPREVEEVLYEHPAVKEAAAVGVPDPYSGEAVKAFVTLKEGYEGKVKAEEIIAFCKERLAAYKAPKYVEFRKELPKTLVGKILRRELREERPK